MDELGYPFLRQEYYCDGISINIHWNTNIVMKGNFHRSTPMGLYGERTTPHEDKITTNWRWWGKKNVGERGIFFSSNNEELILRNMWEHNIT